jgi:hypothetical protein
MIAATQRECPPNEANADRTAGAPAVEGLAGPRTRQAAINSRLSSWGKRQSLAAGLVLYGTTDQEPSNIVVTQ